MALKINEDILVKSIPQYCMMGYHGAGHWEVGFFYGLGEYGDGDTFGGGYGADGYGELAEPDDLDGYGFGIGGDGDFGYGEPSFVIGSGHGCIAGIAPLF